MSAEWKPLPALPDLRRVGIIALDTETQDGGLLSGHGSSWPWCDGYIAGVSVAYRVEGVIRAHYFPMRHPDSPNFDPAQVFQWVRDHAASGVSIVTQNGLYDWGWLRTDAGIAMPPSDRLEEIGALATMVDEGRKKYSLDALCAWRGLPPKDETCLKAAAHAAGFPKRVKVQPSSGNSPHTSWDRTPKPTPSARSKFSKALTQSSTRRERAPRIDSNATCCRCVLKCVGAAFASTLQQPNRLAISCSASVTPS
jgi:hypothetical protein